MQTGGQGGVKKLITKLVNIFMCNGARRLSNQCFSLVVGILSLRHWAFLVSGWPALS